MGDTSTTSTRIATTSTGPRESTHSSSVHSSMTSISQRMAISITGAMYSSRLSLIWRREDGHPWRRRHLLRYREPRRTAVQLFMLPAAAGLLQHDQQLLLVCGSDESRWAAGISDPASDRLWVRPSNAFQSEWCGFHI